MTCWAISEFGILRKKLFSGCFSLHYINHIGIKESINSFGYYVIQKCYKATWIILTIKVCYPCHSQHVTHGPVGQWSLSSLSIPIWSFYGKRKCPKRQFICFAAEQPLYHLNPNLTLIQYTFYEVDKFLQTYYRSHAATFLWVGWFEFEWVLSQI